MNETSISEEFTLDESELLNGDQYFDGVKQTPPNKRRRFRTMREEYREWT